MKTVCCFLIACLFVTSASSQKIDISHPEKSQRSSITANKYVMFEYEFINADHVPKWGIVKGQILEIKENSFLLEQGSQQQWFEVDKLWAIKRVRRGAYRRFMDGVGRLSGLHNNSGGTMIGQPVTMQGGGALIGLIISVIDQAHHSKNFRFTQSRGWEFGVQ